MTIGQKEEQGAKGQGETAQTRPGEGGAGKGFWREMGES